MIKSPHIHRHGDLTDTIREIRRPVHKPATGWTNVVATTADLPAGDPGVINSSTDTGWTPVFQNSWQNLGGVYPPTGFYLSDDGEVRLRGGVTGGASGSVVFTLPIGVRPEFNTRIVCPTDAAGSYATFEISTNGDVTFVG